MAWKTIEQKIEMFKENRTDTIVEPLNDSIAKAEIDLENEKMTASICQCSGRPYVSPRLLKIMAVSGLYFGIYYIDVILGGILVGW